MRSMFLYRSVAPVASRAPFVRPARAACVSADGSRFGPSERSSFVGALRFSVRWLTKSQVGELDHAVRLALRAHGEIPLAKITSFFPDEVLELLGEIDGGLGRFVRDRPHLYSLRHARTPNAKQATLLLSLVDGRRTPRHMPPPSSAAVLQRGGASQAHGAAPQSVTELSKEDLMLAQTLEVILHGPSGPVLINQVFASLSVEAQQFFSSAFSLRRWMSLQPTWFYVQNDRVQLQRRAQAEELVFRALYAQPHSGQSNQCVPPAATACARPVAAVPIPPAPPPPTCTNSRNAPSGDRRFSSKSAFTPAGRSQFVNPSSPVPPEMSRARVFLEQNVPYTHYIPLSMLRQRCPSAWSELGLSSADAPVREYVAKIRSLPRGIVDCREFGTEPTESTVFLRLLCVERAVLRIPKRQSSSSPLRQPRSGQVNSSSNVEPIVTSIGRELADNAFQHLDVLPHAAAVVSDVQSYLQRTGPEGRNALARSVTMSGLKEVLHPQTICRLRRLVFPFSSPVQDANTPGEDGSAPPSNTVVEPDAVFPEEALILVFDRMRHVFRVDLTRGTIALWSLLPDLEQPSSLTLQTTPIPLVLRCVQLILENGPLTPAGVCDRLPPFAAQQLRRAYPAVETNPGAALEASLQQFVHAHSLYFFVRKGRVWTPHLAAQMRPGLHPTSAAAEWEPDQLRESTRELTDAEKANIIFSILPVHAVNWIMFCRAYRDRDSLPFSLSSITMDFFAKHRTLFTVYEPLFQKMPVVGRIDGIPPPSQLLSPPCHTLTDLVKVMALYSAGGMDESSLLNLLAKDARIVVKRFGSLERIATQLPMWFEVRNDLNVQGQAIITYIGADQANTEKRGEPGPPQ